MFALFKLKGCLCYSLQALRVRLEDCSRTACMFKTLHAL